MLSGPKRKGRLAGLGARVAERLAKSSRVFFLGLLFACGIEVLVDWNAILFEINVLRDGMRQRGQNYVSILAKAAAGFPRDPQALGALCAGLWGDVDVIFVRFTDDRGRVVYDRLRPSYESAFQRRRGQPFRAYFHAQIERDTTGILADPAGLASRMANSRHRDFVQAWNDLIARLVAMFIAPRAPEFGPSGVVLYQDRLKTRERRHEAEVTYALGTIVGPRGEQRGVALVAFSMARVNAAIVKKYLKGAGMGVFFISLILIQNLTSRRDKLRLRALEEKNAAARQALLAAQPGPASLPGLSVAAALERAEGALDGLLWDVHVDEAGVQLLVIDPDGEGVPAAAAALQVQRAFQARRRDGIRASLVQEAAALGQAAAALPLALPVGLLLLRVAAGSFVVNGVKGPLGGVRLLGADGTAKALDEAPLDDRPEGLRGPLRLMSGALPEQGLLAAIFCGPGTRDRDPLRAVQAVAAYIGRSRRTAATAADLAATGAAWARDRSRHAAGDALVVVVGRT